MSEQAGTVAQYLEDVGALDTEENVAVWPHPYGDPVVEGVRAHDATEAVYVANGTGNVPRVEALHKADEDGKFHALDHMYDRKVLSYDLPEMVTAGEIPEIDIEVARDPAMSVMHNPVHGEAMAELAQQDCGTEDYAAAAENVHEVFTDIIHRNAETSAALAGEEGYTVHATNDFGTAARDPVIEDGPEGYEQRMAAYEDALIGALAEQFEDVTVVENDGSVEPVLRGQRYLIGTNDT